MHNFKIYIIKELFENLFIRHKLSTKETVNKTKILKIIKLFFHKTVYGSAFVAEKKLYTEIASLK